MKQLLKYIFLVVMLVMASLAAHARTINVDVDKIRGDLPMELRALCENVAFSDTVVFNFGKGSYKIDATVICKCHVVMRGLGAKKSKVVFAHGHSRNGQRAYTSDAFFKFQGTPAQPITVSISDLAFGIQEHDGILWKDAERHAVKILHANRVDIHDVDSYLENAYITNFDLRVCSNVTFVNNTVTNFNNCETGGCLWLRGEMHNITVKGNKFFKYGKDETLAIFDNVIDNSKGYVAGAATRTGIVIEDNEFRFGGYKGRDKDPAAVPGMVFSLFTGEQEKPDPCTTTDFHLRNNRFYLDDATMRCIYIGFLPKDKHRDIYIENNQIFNNDIRRDWKYYHDDITVNDKSSGQDTIHIAGNSIVNRTMVTQEDGSNGYMFLRLYNGHVALTGNKLVDEVTVNPATGKPAGVQLIYCTAAQASVSLKDNVFKGVGRLAYLSASKGMDTFTLNAVNNYFSGDPHVYCNKIRQVNINFTSNTLLSNNPGFFLRNFPEQGSLTFTHNDVTVIPGNGKFLIQWGSGSDNRMRFQRLEITNNVFHGVKGEQEMLKNIRNIGKRKVKANTYYAK